MRASLSTVDARVLRLTQRIVHELSPVVREAGAEISGLLSVGESA